MTERDHTAIEELLSADALDGLDDADRAELDRQRAEHGDCEECARLEAELGEVAAGLGLSLDPVPVPAGMADEILRAADAEPEEHSPAGPTDLVTVRERRSGAWKGLVAVAAAFLFVCGFLVRSATDQGGGELASSRFVRFTGEAGTFAMAYEPGEPGVVFFGSDLPDPGSGQVYEIWMIEGEGAPVSGGCVIPQDGRVLTFVDADIGDTDTMAVTVEPDSCPGAPTTTPVLTASIA